MNGGYQIIDLGNVEIQAGGTTITGLYDAIEGCEKTILLTGVNDATLGEIKPFFAAFIVSGTDFVADIQGSHTITVDDDDKVVIA